MNHSTQKMFVEKLALLSTSLPINLEHHHVHAPPADADCDAQVKTPAQNYHLRRDSATHVRPSNPGHPSISLDQIHVPQPNPS